MKLACTVQSHKKVLFAYKMRAFVTKIVSPVAKSVLFAMERVELKTLFTLIGLCFVVKVAL